jgi:hypothetical protein
MEKSKGYITIYVSLDGIKEYFSVLYQRGFLA